MSAATPLPPVSLVGHPFLLKGRGQHLRCAFRSWVAAGLSPGLCDVYGLQEPDAAHADLVQARAPLAEAGVRIFHLNADEVEQATRHIGATLSSTTFDVVYPSWELENFPAPWVSFIDRFDEVWADSEFTARALQASVSIPVRTMPLGHEPRLTVGYDRRSFGLPESSFAFLSFADPTSFFERKNPVASIRAFHALLRLRPGADVRLVLKVNGPDLPEPVRALLGTLSEDTLRRIIVVTGTFTEERTLGLVYACDGFLSLHRSEGFGLVILEAMALGRPVVATRYSGSEQFMRDDVSLPVDHELVPVPPGAYPFADGQRWAEPDLDQAVRSMARLVDEPELGRQLGLRARTFARRLFSHRSAGLRYRRWLEQWAGARDAGAGGAAGS